MGRHLDRPSILRRREFVGLAAVGGVGSALGVRPDPAPAASGARRDRVTLFLCGDVMLGRGIDQILPDPVDPGLHEPAVTSATGYVELAERANGPIPRPVDLAYVWGDALAVLDRVRPAARIVNLETSITRSDHFYPKGINYRMSPENALCLEAAGIDCCVLANNHVLDWGRQGLVETLAMLERLGIRTAGAGRDAEAAAAPAVLEVSGGTRVLVFSFGSSTSGIPSDWAAAPDQPGVHLLPDLSRKTVGEIAERTRATRAPGTIAIASIHWGENWGYDVPGEQRRFAHALIDEAGFDLVHGHSSHHPKGIEVHRDRPILYGCGDFLNDYEGIAGYERFRDDLTLMYFPTLSASDGRLLDFELVPLQIRKFRLNRPSEPDMAWLRAVLDRESRRLGVRLEETPDGRWTLGW